MAILEACFGAPHKIPRKNTHRAVARRLRRGRRSSARRTTPLSSSTTATAAHHGSCTRHVKVIREAVGQIYLERQDSELKALPPASLAVAEVAFDETERKVCVPHIIKGRFARGKVVAVHIVRSIMMVHATLLWSTPANKGAPDQEASTRTYDLVCAPALLKSTTALNLLAGLRARLRGALDLLGAKARRFVIVLVSDNAKACKKAGRLLQKQTSATGAWMLHSLCLSHQTMLCINEAHFPLKVLGPLFCATTLLRHGTTWLGLQENLHKYVQERLQITTSPPTSADAEYLEALLDLIFPPRAPRDVEGFLRSRRQQQQRAEFGRLLAGTGHGSVALTHYCPPGCCSSRTESVEKVFAALLQFWAGSLPSIPALNRWTSLQEPVAWFATGMLLQGLLPACWPRGVADSTDGNADAATSMDLSLIHI